MRKFTKYPSNYVKATRQEPYYRGGYTKQYDCSYIVLFNGGGTGKYYADLNRAISDLRNMIDDTIRRDGIESVDFEDCLILEYLGNGESGREAYNAADDKYFKHI